MIDCFCIKILIKQSDDLLPMLYLLWHKEMGPNWQKKTQKTNLTNQNSLSEINTQIP